MNHSIAQFALTVVIAVSPCTASFAQSKDPEPVRKDLNLGPLMGISEWHHSLGKHGIGPENAIEVCVETHRTAGFDTIVWNCGRSVLHYGSELPSATTLRQQPVTEESRPLIEAVFEKHCPLRRAVELCHSYEMTIMGRLAMNRHYGPELPQATSRFAKEHPEYHERDRKGRPITHKLCYAIEAVQDERIEILMEIQRFGVDALLLDFCRQPPFLMYHDALVQPYLNQTGQDPRQLDFSDTAAVSRWWEYRAGVLTGFMRRLKEASHRQAEILGRPCPIVVRIPDSSPQVMMAYGLDVEQWLKEDLIDATMLSPLPLVVEDLERHPKHHIEMAHRYGKPCYGGIGALGLSKPETFDMQPAVQFLHEQYEAGADGMSLYQSLLLMLRHDHLQPLIQVIGDREQIAAQAASLAPSKLSPQNASVIGLDNHAYRPATEGIKGKGGMSLKRAF